MKILIATMGSFALLASVVAAGQNEKQQMELRQVEHIEIVKKGEQARRLDKKQAGILLDAWNRSKPKGLCKYRVEYWIHMYLANGKLIAYRTNGQHIKAENDYCFLVDEPQLFESLWNSSAKE